ELGDVEIARRIDGQVPRREQLRAGSRSAVAEDALRAAGISGDRAVRREAADAIIPEVGDIEISGEVDRKPVRIVELRRNGRAAVAAESGRAGARHGDDGPAGGHFADLV